MRRGADPQRCPRARMRGPACISGPVGPRALLSQAGLPHAPLLLLSEALHLMVTREGRLGSMRTSARCASPLCVHPHHARAPASALRCVAEGCGHHLTDACVPGRTAARGRA